MSVYADSLTLNPLAALGSKLQLYLGQAEYSRRHRESFEEVWQLVASYSIENQAGHVALWAPKEPNLFPQDEEKE